MTSRSLLKLAVLSVMPWMTVLTAAPAGLLGTESFAQLSQRVESIHALTSDVASGDRSVAREERESSDPPIVMASGKVCLPCCRVMIAAPKWTV